MRTFKLRHFLTLTAAAVLLVVPVRASDPVGVYALIERIVFEPGESSPTAVQLWGVFALSDGRTGDGYQTPQRGYLYYSIAAENERACRAEWTDFKRLAGTGQPVGFGARYANLGRVRRAGETPASPDVYPLGRGLVQMLTAHSGPSIQQDLLHVPAPVKPADGGRVAPGPVSLVVRNVADTASRYLFEIEGPSSERETSAPVAAGRTETSWSPRLQIKDGQRYTWRVWTVTGNTKGAPATSSFTGGR